MNAVLPFPEPGAVRRITGFMRLLRLNGYAVGLREGLDAVRLARTLDLERPAELRWSLKALTSDSEANWRRFDELFDAYWLGHRRPGLIKVSGDHGARQSRGGAPAAGVKDPDAQEAVEGDGGAGPAEAETGEGGASAAENLAKTDLRHINDPESWARVHALTARLAARLRSRLTRREKVRRRGRRVDLRHTIHRSIAYGGMPMRLAFRRRRTKPLRLVVLLDASGSMNQYSAFFVRFLHGVLDNYREAEAFVFHTRLIHLSPALRERKVERAIERLSLMAAGWSGGTRIADCLAEFNRHHAERTINSRTVVMIVSDGYDTCPPDQLSREMARLKRRARRLVWLNPMMGWQGYEPVACGMTAALPHIDLFAPAHSVESLMALEPYLARL